MAPTDEDYLLGMLKLPGRLVEKRSLSRLAAERLRHSSLAVFTRLLHRLEELGCGTLYEVNSNSTSQKPPILVKGSYDNFTDIAKELIDRDVYIHRMDIVVDLSPFQTALLHRHDQVNIYKF